MLYAGYIGGTFDYSNAYEAFATAPQIYTPTAPLGQRWSALLTDSGIDRGYHNSALLIASGEVLRLPMPTPVSTISISQLHFRRQHAREAIEAVGPDPSDRSCKCWTLIMLALPY